jgi:hypothetical protein
VSGWPKNTPKKHADYIHSSIPRSYQKLPEIWATKANGTTTKLGLSGKGYIGLNSRRMDAKEKHWLPSSVQICGFSFIRIWDGGPAITTELASSSHFQPTIRSEFFHGLKLMC